MPKIVNGYYASGLCVGAVWPELGREIHRNQGRLPVIGNKGHICSVHRAL